MENDLETQVALMRKDLDNFTSYMSKMDVTVSKISEVSNDVSKLLALHEERIETLYNNNRTLDSKLEKRDFSLSEEMKDIHQHLRNNNRDFMEKIKSFEEIIKNEIKYVKDTIDRENKFMKDDISEAKSSIKENQMRISALEKWRYKMVGCLIVATWIINKIPLDFTHIIK